MGLKRPARTPWGGSFDLLLVLGLCAAVVHRTPVGMLLLWGVERVGGSDAALPSLTATFSAGWVAVPAGPIALAPPAADDGALPEPWRSALVSALGDGVPDAVASRLVAAELPPDAAGALVWVDQRYAGEPERAIAELALEGALIDRAVGRAAAAGADSPTSYATYRRYLPGPERTLGDRVVGTALAVGTALDLGWPVDPDARITSGFGERVHPVLKTRRFHNGVDVGVPIGTPVRAPQDGVVDTVGENGVSGKYLTIDHGHGVSTTYCHLDAVDVGRGLSVSRGQRVATSGNTGRSTGPHLHYIVRVAGDAVDPQRFRTSLRRP